MLENRNSWPQVLLTSSDENAKLIYEKDWADSEMGPIENWSLSFITILTTSIASQFPALMLWGDKFITFYNAGYAAILGDKQYWALGKPLQEVWPEAWESLYGMLKGVIATGNGSWAENQIYYLHRDGYPEESYFTFSFARIIDERGGFGGILCTAIETTTSVIAQRRLKTLRELGNRAGACATLDAVYAESISVLKSLPRDIPFAIVRMIMPDGVTVVVKCLFGVIAPNRSLDVDIDTNHPLLVRMIETGQPELVSDIPADIKQLPSQMGLDAVTSVFVLPIKESLNGKVTGFLSIGLSPHLPFDESYRSFLDLVALQISAAVAGATAQEKARTRVQELAKLDELKTAFFSNVSHEFRTPLTLLLAPLEDALAHSTGTDVLVDKASFDLIYRNALRLLKLVNSLLDFTRIEAGKAEASFQPVNLSQYTTGLASQFRQVMEKGNLKFELFIDDLTEPIYVDIEMWEKIVLNLLSNAFKFTLRGGVKVYLKEAADSVEFQIEDTGTGISEEELPKIFDRFHRVEGAKSRTFEGSGIGLALVKALVKIHGGTIAVESRLATGTLVSIVLLKGSQHLPPGQVHLQMISPVDRLESASLVEEASKWIPVNHVPEVIPDRATILVIDDNADMGEYLERKLTPVYNVYLASNGREALHILNDMIPDLIISDIMMPEMSGFELLNTIRRNRKTASIPVIFLSARAGNEATIEGLEAGADDYLVKPFSSKELLARVHTQLSVVKLRSDLETEKKALTARDEFLSIASHELNTPLTPLKLQVQTLSWLLEQGNFTALSTERVKSIVNILDRQIDRISNLIRDLMDVTRISRGKLVLNKHRTDLNTLVTMVIEEYREEIIQAQCKLTVDLKEHVTSLCDPARIEQVITNLITNAIKYASGTEIRIATCCKNGYAMLAVSDKGSGISTENLPKIFDRYERINVSTTFGGLGLGLYISKQIVDAHDGKIEVESKVGEGTKFCVSLPLFQEVEFPFSGAATGHS